jgi:hypothetical protein
MTATEILVLMVIALIPLLLVVIAILLSKISRTLARAFPPPRPPQSGFTIRQTLQGDTTMAITGIVAGLTGTFTETPTPAGSTIPAGTIPQWTSSDPTVTLTPSADGTQVVAAVPATFTAPSFTLTVANQDGSFPTPATIPVTQPVIAQTGFTIDQVA